jgi:DNA-binding response OmpR family regulator
VIGAVVRGKAETLATGLGGTGHGQSVLVCDGDRQSLRALKTVLGGSGFAVWSTQSAEEALTRAALRAPDAAIIEMDLVDSSGTDVCRLLRQWSSMPLIILSQVSDEDQMVDAFRAGVDDYLTKPFSPRELVVRLEARLRQSSPWSLDAAALPPPAVAHAA